MGRVIAVAASMYTIARAEFGYRVGTNKLSVCSAVGIVSPNLVAFLHISPSNAMSASRLVRDVVEQMAEYREIAGIGGAPGPTRIYGLQGGSDAFGQILDAAQSAFPGVYEALPKDQFSYSPTFRGFALEPRTGAVDKPPPGDFDSANARVVSLADARTGVLQALFDEGVIK